MVQYGMQRQRHGTTKKLVEGFGGLIVGAALVILIGKLFEKSPSAKQPPENASTDASTGEAGGQT